MIGIICWIMAAFSSYAAYSFYTVKDSDVSNNMQVFYQVWFYAFIVVAVVLFVIGLISFVQKLNGNSKHSNSYAMYKGNSNSGTNSDAGLFSFMSFDSGGGSCDSGSSGGDGGGGGD